MYLQDFVQIYKCKTRQCNFNKIVPAQELPRSLWVPFTVGQCAQIALTTNSCSTETHRCTCKCNTKDNSVEIRTLFSATCMFLDCLFKCSNAKKMKTTARLLKSLGGRVLCTRDENFVIVTYGLITANKHQKANLLSCSNRLCEWNPGPQSFATLLFTPDYSQSPARDGGCCWEAHGLGTPSSTSPSPLLPNFPPTTAFQKSNQLTFPNRKTAILKEKQINKKKPKTTKNKTKNPKSKQKNLNKTKKQPKHYSLTASLKK